MKAHHTLIYGVTMKAVPKENTWLWAPRKRKLGKAYTSCLIAHLKSVEQKEANTPNQSRRQEITKLRAEINHIEMKNYIKNQNQSNKQTTTKKNWGWFFDNINKIDKPLTRLTRRNRDSIQIIKIRNEKGDITTEIKEIKKITRSHFKKPISTHQRYLD